MIISHQITQEIVMFTRMVTKETTSMARSQNVPLLNSSFILMADKDDFIKSCFDTSRFLFFSPSYSQKSKIIQIFFGHIFAQKISLLLCWYFPSTPFLAGEFFSGKAYGLAAIVPIQMAIQYFSQELHFLAKPNTTPPWSSIFNQKIALYKTGQHMNWH